MHFCEPFLRCRVFGQMAGRANGALHEISTAVWTDMIQPGFDAYRAECAFKGTNARVGRLGR